MRPVAVLETRCPTHVNKFLKFAVFKFFSRIVVNKLSDVEKVHFRKWETYSTKHSKCKADIQFLEFCASNQLFPKFIEDRIRKSVRRSNSGPKNASADSDQGSHNYKKSLLDNEIKKQKEHLQTLQKEVMQLTCIFRRATSDLKFYAGVFFMQPSLKKQQVDTKLTYEKKLRNLYQGNIVTKTDRSIVTNLSNYDLTVHEH